MEDYSANDATPLLGNKSVGGHSLSQRLGHPASTTPQHQPESSSIDSEPKDDMDLSRKSQWIALAVMSGACAAFNGVFAKLYVTLFLPPPLSLFFSCGCKFQPVLNFGLVLFYKKKQILLIIYHDSLGLFELLFEDE